VVNTVKDEIDKDILNTKKPKWNAGVGVVGHPKPDQLSATLFEIKHGFRDEAVKSTKPQAVYAGTDTRDVYHSGWNVSTECIGPRDQERFFQAT
jgi:hypothetical protein